MDSTFQLPETLLFSYRIASGDMKYIEINTREIYLRRDPAGGFVLRGEIPDCGASCYATLSRVFLEYAMSCRGLEDSSEMLETVIQFGEQLGQKMAASFKSHDQDNGAQDLVPVIFDCIIASMEGQFKKEGGDDHLAFTFQDSPLATTAGKYGHHLWISPAYQGFVAFFQSILKSTSGGWDLIKPKSDDLDQSLQVIRLKKVL
jgi:hypothetical protein